MSKPYPKGKASTPVRNLEPVAGLKEPGGRVWTLWALSYALGCTVGSLVSAGITSLLASGSGSSSATSITLSQVFPSLVGTFIWGAILGSANWLVLFMHMKNIALWPIATGIGLALGSILVSIVFPLIFPVGANQGTDELAFFVNAADGAALGLMVGIAQAAILMRRVSDRPGILTFVLTTTIGWLGAIMLESLLNSATSSLVGLSPFRELTILFLGFGLAGIISGFEISSLMKKHQQQLLEENKPDAQAQTSRTNRSARPPA